MELSVIEVEATDVRKGDLIKYRQATLAGMRTVEAAVAEVTVYQVTAEEKAVEVILANGDGFEYRLDEYVIVSRWL